MVDINLICSMQWREKTDKSMIEKRSLVSTRNSVINNSKFEASKNGETD